jgi:antitoxin YefM
VYKIVPMKAITYAQARKNLATALDRVCEDGAPVIITRIGVQQAVVLLALRDFEQFEETAHLMRSPANASRLTQAIQELAR